MPINDHLGKKASEYTSDTLLNKDDVVIGQDAESPEQNKNYPLGNLKIYVYGGVGKAGQVLKSNGDGTWGWYDSGATVTTTTTTVAPTTTTTTAATTTTTTTAGTTTTTTSAPSSSQWWRLSRIGTNLPNNGFMTNLDVYTGGSNQANSAMWSGGNRVTWANTGTGTTTLNFDNTSPVAGDYLYSGNIKYQASWYEVPYNIDLSNSHYLVIGNTGDTTADWFATSDGLYVGIRKVIKVKKDSQGYVYVECVIDNLDSYRGTWNPSESCLTTTTTSTTTTSSTTTTTLPPSNPTTTTTTAATTTTTTSAGYNYPSTPSVWYHNGTVAAGVYYGHTSKANACSDLLSNGYAAFYLRDSGGNICNSVADIDESLAQSRPVSVFTNSTFTNTMNTNFNSQYFGVTTGATGSPEGVFKINNQLLNLESGWTSYYQPCTAATTTTTTTAPTTTTTTTAATTTTTTAATTTTTTAATTTTTTVASGTLTYGSFTNVGESVIYISEFNSKLYAFPANNARILESTDSGSTWSNAAAVNNVAVQRRPVIESNRVLFIDGTSSNNHIESWDGTSTSTSTPVSGTSSLSQIGLFQKIGNYYYINDYAGPLERSTSLSSGWSNIYNSSNHTFITESNGTIVWGGRSGFNGITKDDFATVSSAFSSNFWMDAMATDGNGNWLGSGQNQARYSTDDGVTWGSIELRATGDTGQINTTYENNIINIGNKFVYLDRGNKKLLSISTTLSATPTVTVIKDFTDNSATSNPLAINKIGNTLYVTDYYNTEHGVHEFTIS